MITEAQRELRRKHVGASDVPAILGLDQYRTDADVWIYKTQGVDDPADSSEAVELGNDFEPVGVQRLARRFLSSAVSDPPTAAAANGIMIAHADCLLVPIDEAWRIPTKPDLRGLLGAGALPGEVKWRGDTTNWGEDGSDQVPVSVTAQVYGQAICLGVPKVYVGAFFPKYRGVEFRAYEIPIKPDIAREIEDRVCAWWEAHVVKGVMPDTSSRAPSLELVRRIARRPGTVVPVSAELVRSYVAAKAAEREAEKASKAIEARLRAEMAGAEGAECEGFEIEDKEIKRAGYTVMETVYRQLRVKPTTQQEAA